jgi:hypothetical protein
MKTFKSSFILQFAIFVSCLGILAACKKENGASGNAPTTGYYMKFKANGTQVNFTASLASKDTLIYGFYAMGVAGVNSSTSDQFELDLYSYSLPSNGLSFSGGIVPETNQPAAFLTYGIYSTQSVFTSLPSTNNEVSVVFTEVTDDYIKGTFSGTLYADLTTVKYKITDGEFYAARQK